MCQPLTETTCSWGKCETPDIGANQSRITSVDHDGRQLTFCSWDCNHRFANMMVEAEDEAWIRKQKVA